MFVLNLYHENSILGSSLAREIELLKAKSLARIGVGAPLDLLGHLDAPLAAPSPSFLLGLLVG
jgi:hypothetical protein